MSGNPPNQLSSESSMVSHLDALYGYGIALTRNPTEAEDLVQETYARAAGSFQSLRLDSNIKAWMFTIMRNLWLKQLRSARRSPEFVNFDDNEDLQAAFDSEQDPEHLYARLWERDEIRSALARMPIGHREIILLRHFEGFNYKELAEMLECPVGTVMSRLARARAKLKQELLGHQQELRLANRSG